jgi:hypothetical protein
MPININDQDYVKAEAQKLFEQQNSKQNPQPDPQAEAAASRAQEVMQQEATFEKSTPEYGKLVNENADFFQELASDQALQSAVTSTDNAPLALYALMKEDNLGALYGLPPVKAAAELARAEIRGQGYLTPKKTATNAPQPVRAAKGSGARQTSIEKMDGLDLLKSIRK